MNFQNFQLSEKLQLAIKDAGYTEATDIQSKSIPLILEGKDIIGFSQTGSGKTAAFGLPAIEMIDYNISPKKTQIIILCPTRELAMQATDEFRKFSKYIEGLHIVPIYGGQSIDRQFQQLRKGCQIVIGTPGRVMDHMRRKTLKINEIKMVILDEADEMLNMGFREDIETILEKTPEERQTVLFSATMPKPILAITKKYQKNPEMIKIERKKMTVDTIEQSYFEVDRKHKADAISVLLQYNQPRLSIIFCNTKRMVDDLVRNLRKRGYTAQGLHGDISQNQRTQVMNGFKNGEFSVLVATDVAARGIDVDDVDIVFNYDIPADNEYYVHRIGRTGRAGRDGKSFTFVSNRMELSSIRSIEKYAKCHIEKGEFPNVDDINKQNKKKVLKKIEKCLKKRDCSEQQENLDILKERGYTSDEIAMALLTIYTRKNVLKEGTVNIPSFSIKKSGRDDRGNRRGRRDNGGKNQGRFDREKKKSGNNSKAFNNGSMEIVTISIGKSDRVTPNNILGAVAGESGVPGNLIGGIDIHKDYSTVEVPKEFRKVIVKSLNNKKIKNRKVMVK